MTAYLPAEDYARRMGLSLTEVMDLVTSGTLTAQRHGGWLLQVQPTPEAKTKKRRAKNARP